MPTRGRPKGSTGKKKISSTKSSSQPSLRFTLPRSEHSDSDSDMSDAETGLNTEFSITIEKIKRNISSELERMEKEFNKAILDLRRTVSDLSKENTNLKERCDNLEEKILKLEHDQTTHDTLINKQERFSRRNNVRIVGMKFAERENCIEIASKVFCEIGLPSCKIERAHRDGKAVRGNDRHILVKISFFQDKLKIMKDARQALNSKEYYVIDDLTPIDLKEKRKWKTQVQELYQNGTRLHFSGGYWRGSNGKPYNFRTTT